MLDLPTLVELFSDSKIVNLSAGDILSREDIAGLSFCRHPLGFIHAVLARNKGYALRLHVWPDAHRYEQEPFWPIHNHKFDLTSRVLIGSLTNSEYAVIRTSEKTIYQLYDVTYGAGTSKLLQSAIQVVVKRCYSKHAVAPSVYSVKAGAFHDTFVPRGVFTATLALTKDALPDADVKTVGDSQGHAEYEYIRSEIDATEKAAVVARLTELL